MKLAIFGATGGIGTKAVELALARGHQVTAAARRPEAVAGGPHPQLRVVPCDVLDPAQVRAAIDGQDAVISAIGTNDRASTVRSAGTRNILAAMAEVGVKRLACVSAIGVADSREQARRSSFVFGRIILPLLLERPFADMKDMEDAVRESGLEWIIVRPTGLKDRPASGAIRVVTDGGRVGSAIPRADVAGFLLDEVSQPRYLGQAVSIYA